MEIPVANKYVQFVIGNGDGDIGVAFLTSPQPEERELEDWSEDENGKWA